MLGPALGLLNCRCRGVRLDLEPTSVQASGPRDPRQVAPGQAAAVKIQPGPLPASRVGRRVGHFGSGDEGPVNGQKERRYANGDHAAERNQGGGDDQTQMRVQRPISLRPTPAPRRSRARITALWRDYVRSAGRLPVEIATVFNASRFSRWGRALMLEAAGLILPPNQRLRKLPDPAVCQSPGSTLDCRNGCLP